MNKNEVTVIIVNWNAGRLLNECIERLYAQTVKPKKIILIDNNSRDGSVDCIKQNNSLKIILLDENIGFAAANNFALKFVETEFVALINPDAFAENNWLEKLIEAAERHKDYAAFGSHQIDFCNQKKLDGIGDVYHISGLVWRNGHGCAKNYTDYFKSEIFSPCACAALYRRKILKRIDFMDKDYFCYVEDVDLGFRLRLYGYKSMYVPEAIVRHVGSATSGGKHSKFAIYHGHRNIVWTYIKNMPGTLFWALLPLHIIMNVFTVYYFALNGFTTTILKAKFDAIKKCKYFWIKRRKIQKERVASIKGIWDLLDKRFLPQKKA